MYQNSIELLYKWFVFLCKHMHVYGLLITISFECWDILPSVVSLDINFACFE